MGLYVWSDAAIEAADVVLMTDEPSKLVTAIGVARATKHIAWQNISFWRWESKDSPSVSALWVSATMWEAVFGDVGVMILGSSRFWRAWWGSNIEPQNEELFPKRIRQETAPRFIVRADTGRQPAVLYIIYLAVMPLRRAWDAA